MKGTTTREDVKETYSEAYDKIREGIEILDDNFVVRPDDILMVERHCHFPRGSLDPHKQGGEEE